MSYEENVQAWNDSQQPEGQGAVRSGDLLCRWRELTKVIQERKAALFPVGAIVYVECPQYNGYGIATADSDCRDDLLPVKLENGNVWWYPMECCQRITDLTILPRYARRMKLQFHGLQAA